MKFLKKSKLPVIPLRDIVVFPHMIVPFFVGRKRSIGAVEEAMTHGKIVFLMTQKENDVEEPKLADLYRVGTVGRILQRLKLPDGTLRLLAEGRERAGVVEFSDSKDMTWAQIKVIRESNTLTPELSALVRSAQSEFTRYSQLLKKIPQEVVGSIERIETPDQLVNVVCANVPLKVDKKAELLSIVDPAARMERLIAILMAEIQVLELGKKINSKVRKRLEKNQKQYFLNEQLKEIQKELGKDQDDPTGAKELEEKLKAKELPQDVLEKCIKEVKRLARLQPISPESGVLRTYLEWICDLPWGEYSQDSKDIEKARRILDEDHYGLKKVKERILDFIAVRQLKERVKGPILCFVGPPGTGKTSLGMSVARCLGREFVRVSLGGVRDEAEIRGHRKTYIGALPGKIIQSMRKASTRNPVFLLDEIDKMSSDFRGDPASAMLEVLDPEQNSTFVDHYLEVSYNLRDVMFITTANSVHNIPYPLRDRMEIIEIAGYTEFEKEKIAEQFLIPKQLEENGLGWADITFQKTAIHRIINNYTMESGVRNLEREIANIIRKIARQAVKKGLVDQPPEELETEGQDIAVRVPLDRVPAGSVAVEPPATGGATEQGAVELSVKQSTNKKPGAAEKASRGNEKTAVKSPVKTVSAKKREFRSVVTPRGVQKYLGKIRFQETGVSLVPKPGLAYGLAWTEMGGTLLPVEIALFSGKGELILTGNLGDVMKESAHTALSFLRANAAKLNLPEDFCEKQDIHIHVPEGAIPKDGPSAGITITAALMSAITGQEIKKGYAMTGEITLTDRLLPVGGVKEKILAAHRNHMTQVLMPELNRKDIDELPREVITSLNFTFAETMIHGLLSLFPSEAFQKKPEKREKHDKNRERSEVAVSPPPAGKKSARS